MIQSKTMAALEHSGKVTIHPQGLWSDTRAFAADGFRPLRGTRTKHAACARNGICQYCEH